MTGPKFDKANLKQLGGVTLCGVPVGTAGSTGSILGLPGVGEALSLTLVLGAFLGAGVWMFRRWGKSAETPAPTLDSPEPVAEDTRREREPVNA